MLTSDTDGQLVLVPCPAQGAILAGVDGQPAHQHQHHGSTDASDELPVATTDNTCGFALASAPALPSFTLVLHQRLDAGPTYLPAVRDVEIALPVYSRIGARGPPQYS
jgi:hypothetical protein